MPFFLLLAATGSVLGYLTFERNKAWSSPLTLWSDVVRKSPHKARPHYNLGTLYGMEKKTEKSIYHLTRAMEVEPGNIDIHINLGVALEQQGRWMESLSHYRRAIEIDPDYADAHFKAGRVLERSGNTDGAISYFSEALRLKPQSAEIRRRLLKLRAGQ